MLNVTTTWSDMIDTVYRLMTNWLNQHITGIHTRSGGAKEWPDGACAPVVSSCAPAVPRQTSHRHFILLYSTSFSRLTVPFCTATEGRILKAIFSKIFHG